MAYFSNGTEGMMWREHNCDICWHDRNEDEGCPIECLHLLYNYDQHSKDKVAMLKKEVLDTLIPNDGLFAGKCKLLVPVDIAGQLKLFPKGDRNAEESEEGKEETKQAYENL